MSGEPPGKKPKKGKKGKKGKGGQETVPEVKTVPEVQTVPEVPALEDENDPDATDDEFGNPAASTFVPPLVSSVGSKRKGNSELFSGNIRKKNSK